jgi:hypothetical protein
MTNKLLQSLIVVSTLTCFSSPQLMADHCADRAKGKSFTVKGEDECKSHCKECKLVMDHVYDGGGFGQKPHCTCKAA